MTCLRYLHQKAHLRHTGASEDWLTVLRVFGHGLCAWRYSNPALNPWSAPWMLRIGDRLPSTRSNPNRPTVMHLLGSKTPSAGHSTNDSALMGADRVRGSVGELKIRSQCGCLTLGLLRPPRSSSAPGTPLRNQFVAALLGAAGFRSRWGRLALQHPLEVGGAVSTSVWWAFPGRSFPRSCGGPKSHAGDRPPERAVCGGWRRSRTMAVGWLAGRPDSGQRCDSHCSMRVQVKCACVRPDRGSLTSHQDKTA